MPTIAEPESMMPTLRNVLKDVQKLPEESQRSLLRKWSKQVGILEKDAKVYEKQARYTDRDKSRAMAQMFGAAVRELRVKLSEE